MEFIHTIGRFTRASAVLPWGTLLLFAVVPTRAPADQPDVVWESIKDQGVVLELVSGGEISGTLRTFDAEAVVLIDATGAIVAVRRSDVANVRIETVPTAPAVQPPASPPPVNEPAPPAATAPEPAPPVEPAQAVAPAVEAPSPAVVRVVADDELLRTASSSETLANVSLAVWGAGLGLGTVGSLISWAELNELYRAPDGGPCLDRGTWMECPVSPSTKVLSIIGWSTMASSAFLTTLATTTFHGQYRARGQWASRGWWITGVILQGLGVAAFAVGAALHWDGMTDGAEWGLYGGGFAFVVGGQLMQYLDLKRKMKRAREGTVKIRPRDR